MSPAAPDLLQLKLVFVTGKGGVGKTTVAAALAQLGADHGKRVLACEVDAKGDLSALFEAALLLDPLEGNPTSEPALYDGNRQAATTIDLGDAAPVVHQFGGDYRNIEYDFGQAVSMGILLPPRSRSISMKLARPSSMAWRFSALYF